MILTLYRLNLHAVFAALLRRSPRGRSRAAKFVLAGLFVAYVAGSIALAMWLLFSLLLVAFRDIGEVWLYWALFAAISFALGVFGTVFVAAGHIFGSKDNETLLSLPIRPGQILVSRLLVLLTIECALSLPLFVPVAHVWLAGGMGTPAGVAMLFAGFLLLPVLTLSVSLLLAWILSAVVVRVRRYRSLLTVVVAVGFLLGYVGLFATVQRRLGDLVTRGTEVAAAFSRAVPPFHAFGVAVADADPLRFVLFLVWVVAPFALLFLILSSRYLTILTTDRGAPRVEYRPRAPRRTGAAAALTRKELAHYWSRPMVVLNATIGSVMALIGAGALVAQQGRLSGYAGALADAVPGLSVPVLATVGIAIVGATNTLSASLISLEGRNLWIARSLPTAPIVVIHAKVAAHLIVSSGPCLLASAATAAVVADAPVDALMIVFVPQAFLALTAVGGMAVNLALPRLDWLTDIQVVKQSASAIVALFGGIGVVATFAMAYLLGFSRIMPPGAYLWLCAGICLAGTVVVSLHLRAGGVRRFEQLTA